MSINSESVMRTQRKKKMIAVEAFGGKCCLCGYHKCLDALEFHHLEKSEKEEKPSYVILRWSFKRAKKELDKCILVCSNCHREIHAAEREERDLDLIRFKRPWIDKECAFCAESFSTKTNKQIYCSVSCNKLHIRKVERPTKEELEELLLDKSWCEVGRIFKVSDNAVRKWAKRYEIIPK